MISSTNYDNNKMIKYGQDIYNIIYIFNLKKDMKKRDNHRKAQAKQYLKKKNKYYIDNSKNKLSLVTFN